MKKQALLYATFICTLLLFSCKKDNSAPVSPSVILPEIVGKPLDPDLVRSDAPTVFFYSNSSSSVSFQERSGSFRTLTEYGPALNGYHRYMIYENAGKGLPDNYTYLISKKPLSAGQDLFTYQIKPGYIIYCTGTDNNKNDNGLRYSKLLPRFRGLKDPAQQKSTPCEPYSITIDWYSIIYDLDTGQIYDEIFLYSQTYTVTCGGGGGGNGGIDPPTPEDPCQEYLDMFHQITEDIIPNASSTSGPSLPGSNGNITKAKSCKGCTYKYSCGWYEPRWNTEYTGVVYKNSATDPIWKWQSFAYTGLNRSGGLMPPCVTATSTSNVSVSINSSQIAEGTGSGTIIFSFSCLSNSEFSTKTPLINDHFDSND